MSNEVVILGPLTGLLHKRWIVALLVLLLVIIAIETFILVALISGWSLGVQSFPKLTLNPPVRTNCATLSYHVISRNVENRTVLFDCSTSTMNISAFEAYAPFTMSYSPEGGKPDQAEPIFTLPAGYLNLSITEGHLNESITPSDFSFRCPPYYLTAAHQTSYLISGKTYTIGVYPYVYDYDYCAIISNSVTSIEGFKIQWVEGTTSNLAPTPSYHITASPSNVSMIAGRNVTVNVGASSRAGYKATLQFSATLGPENSTVPVPPTMTFNVTQATLLPYGAVQVSMTIRSYVDTTKGTFLIYVWVQSPDTQGFVVVTVKVV